MAGYPVTSPNLRREILRRDNYICQYCGTRDFDCIVEHVVPVSRGGHGEPYNLVAACKPCNNRKHSWVWLPKNIEVIAAVWPEWSDEIIRMAAEDKEEYSQPMKRLTIDIPQKLHYKLKMAAIDNDSTIRDMVLDLIREALNPENKKAA